MCNQMMTSEVKKEFHALVALFILIRIRESRKFLLVEIGIQKVFSWNPESRSRNLEC